MLFAAQFLLRLDGTQRRIFELREAGVYVDVVWDESHLRHLYLDCRDMYFVSDPVSFVKIGVSLCVKKIFSVSTTVVFYTSCNS